jgi:hypothetical protein
VKALSKKVRILSLVIVLLMLAGILYGVIAGFVY